MSALPPIADLYRDFRRRAVAIARQVLRDPTEAEDVVQDVFIRLYAKNFRFDVKALASTWLRRIVINSSINSLRARQRRDRLRSPENLTEDPESQAVDNERHEQLLTAMSALSEQHRTVITLFDLRGYTYVDIARLLGCPEGTVKSALNRGRTRLMKEMQSRSPEADASSCASNP